MTLHASASPTAFLVSFCARRLAWVKVPNLNRRILPRAGASVGPAPPPAVNHAAPPPSPGAGIVLLVADCLTQLSSGLIITPATISSESPAAIQVPAGQEEDYEAPKVDSATNDEPRCLSEAQKVESFLTGLTYSESFS